MRTAEELAELDTKMINVESGLSMVIIINLFVLLFIVIVVDLVTNRIINEKN